MKPILVFGGYGIFGSHVARELAHLGFTVTIAGRQIEKANAFAQTLGDSHRALRADVTQPETYRSALVEHGIVVNCAGPFSALGKALLESCLSTKCHYVDIADDRDYTKLVRSYHPQFQKAGLFAIPGCSSLPAISGALALKLNGFGIAQGKPAPEKIHSTLFIGNNNPKGSAAVASALGILGNPISTSSGVIYGFREGKVVLFPSPFGRRLVYAFQSPEYDLFPDLFGAKEVRVFVGFELRWVTKVFHWISYFPKPFQWGAKAILQRAGKFNLLLGHSGGAILTEFFWSDHTSASAVLFSKTEGQRMAALPCVYAVRLLSQVPPITGSGVRTAYELQGFQPLLYYLVQEGFSSF
ncbi:MAG: saccharopine dehydrogenase NADP-binding domain-containing protein [Planctomycetota bacterium]